MRFHSRFGGGRSGSGTFPETLFAYRSATKVGPHPKSEERTATACAFSDRYILQRFIPVNILIEQTRLWFSQCSPGTRLGGGQSNEACFCGHFGSSCSLRFFLICVRFYCGAAWVSQNLHLHCFELHFCAICCCATCSSI